MEVSNASKIMELIQRIPVEQNGFNDESGSYRIERSGDIAIFSHDENEIFRFNTSNGEWEGDAEAGLEMMQRWVDKIKEFDEQERLLEPGRQVARVFDYFVRIRDFYAGRRGRREFKLDGKTYTFEETATGFSLSEDGSEIFRVVEGQAVFSGDIDKALDIARKWQVKVERKIFKEQGRLSLEFQPGIEKQVLGQPGLVEEEDIKKVERDREEKSHVNIRYIADNDGDYLEYEGESNVLPTMSGVGRVKREDFGKVVRQGRGDLLFNRSVGGRTREVRPVFSGHWEKDRLSRGTWYFGGEI